jgi:hypothetical protein
LKIVTGIFIVSVVVVGALLYNRYQSNYQEKIEIAQYNVDIGHYDEAYDAVVDLNPKKKDKDLVEKINMVKFVDIFSPMDFQLNPTNGEADYELILNTLLNGITYCNENMSRADELGVSVYLQIAQLKFTTQLNNYFGLREDEVTQLIAMSGTVKEEKINEIAPRGEQRIKVAQQEEFDQQLKEANPIEITEKKAVHDGDYMYTTGSVKNVSQTSYSYIKVKVTHYDDSGNVIETDWTYAVDSEPLRPDEQHSFEIMTKYRTGMAKFKVEVTEFN